LPFPESSSAFPQTGNKSDKEKSETNESEKEKSIAPFLKPGKATALQGSENERRSLAKKFFVWLNKTHCDLSLNRKYRGEIEGFVLSATFELPVLQEAANEILNGLDPRNSFDQAPDKLATNLPDRCQAIWEQHEQAKQQQKDMKRAEQQLADEVAREDAERAARKAEEPAPLSDKELFS
jgi:hypothetical protein